MRRSLRRTFFRPELHARRGTLLSTSSPGHFPWLWRRESKYAIYAIFGLDRHLGLTPNSNTHNLIDCYHMTSRGHICVQNNESAAMFVYKKNPVGIELFSHVKTFFYSKQYAKLLTMWLQTIYRKSSALSIFLQFERKAWTAFFKDKIKVWVHEIN